MAVGVRRREKEGTKLPTRHFSSLQEKKVAKTINTIAKSPVGKIISKVKPYVNGTLALSGITHGVNEIKNTGFTPQAALDLSTSIPFGLNAIKPIYGFVEKPNSFTRGIGDIQGLNDLIESGVIRGNHYGTAVSARTFSKYINHNRDNFNDIINLTKDPNIAYKYYRNQLTKDEFNKLKNAEMIKDDATVLLKHKGECIIFASKIEMTELKHDLFKKIIK